MMPKNSRKMILSLTVWFMMLMIFSETSLAQCTTNCTPLNETFGSTANCIGFAQSTSADPYVRNHTNIPYAPGGPNNDPNDRQYAVRCDGNENNAGWWGSGSAISDNTTDAPGEYGNFLLVNGNEGLNGSCCATEFYHRTISNLCANTTYSLTFYAANIVKNSSYGLLPAVDAYIYPAGSAVTGVSGMTAGVISSSYGGAPIVSTGTMPSYTTASYSTMPWTMYTSTFTTGAGVTSIDLVLASLYGDNAGGDFTIDDISITWVSGGGVSCTLPVELLSFTAEKFSQNAQLKWITASEKNFSYFSIEKSEDGINFTEIGKVSGKGFASTSANYQFSDFNFLGTTYYRLKMVDRDGSGKYSKVVSLSNEPDRYCMVSKNESGELEININTQRGGPIKVLIYSVLGQKYAEEKIDLSEGKTIILKNLHLGDTNVLVRIITSEGEVLYSDMVPLISE